MFLLSTSDIELLQYALKHDMLDMTQMQANIEMKKKQELLDMHPYSIWCNKQGTWFTYLPDKEKGRIRKKRNSKEAIEALIVDYWKEAAHDATVKEVFYDWLDSKLELKEITLPTYQRYETDFKRYYSDYANHSIKSITALEIEDFLKKSIAKQNLTAKAFGGLRLITYGIFKRAKKRGYVNFSITQVVNDMEISRNAFKKVIKEDYQEVFMEDEQDRITHYLKLNPDLINLGLLLTFATGVRVGELVTLKWSDIHSNTINIRRTESTYRDTSGHEICIVKEYPKSAAGVRDVIVPNSYCWVLDELRLLTKSDEYVFSLNHERVIARQIRKRLYRLCKKLSIYKKSPHKIRKTYGTILLDNHVDDNLITNQMGHTDILCTKRHYHRDRKSTDLKAEILSSIPELQDK